MKKIFSIMIAALMSATMFAVDTQYLPISVIVDGSAENFPQGAKAMVENKLTQLLTRNGIAGMDYIGQFILTATTTPLDKDVIPGPPMKISEKMELNLYIADAYAKTVFSTDFWFPLQLSLDWRPTLGAGLFDNANNGVTSGLYWEMTGIALGVRYKF